MIRLPRSVASGAAVLLLMGAAACESASPSAPEAASLDVIEAAPVINDEDVQAVVLQSLIADKGITSFDAFCVSLGDDPVDPSPVFLDRFAGSTPPVVPVSQCNVAVTGTTYVPTGGPAQYFFIGTPTYTGRRATVSAGFQVNGRFAEFFQCTVRPGAQGSFVVQECVITGAA